jgi:hypothetical protein
MAQAAEGLMMAANPEIGIPMEIGKQLAPHTGTFLMIPFVAFAILFIIIGIIVFSVSKSKTPGIMLMMLGFLLGGGAFLMMVKSEGKRPK